MNPDSEFRQRSIQNLTEFVNIITPPSARIEQHLPKIFCIHPDDSIKMLEFLNGLGRDDLEFQVRPLSSFINIIVIRHSAALLRQVVSRVLVRETPSIPETDLPETTRKSMAEWVIRKHEEAATNRLVTYRHDPHSVCVDDLRKEVNRIIINSGDFSSGLRHNSFDMLETILNDVPTAVLDDWFAHFNLDSMIEPAKSRMYKFFPWLSEYVLKRKADKTPNE